MNLRNADEYHIGLDVGTGSVGWCVVDDNGDLFHFKGKPTWGSRLFPSANTAAATRVKRSQRRRYDRRRERIECLQGIFLDEMSTVDPEFFVRMRQSSLLEEDRDSAFTTSYSHPFFNDSDFSESEYYKAYRTIWHLRQHLMESDEKADVREVYLAFHNIVKYRGNFLHEDETELRASTAHAGMAAQTLACALEEYIEDVSSISGQDISCSPDVLRLQEALEKTGQNRTSKAKLVQEALGFNDKARAKALSKACVGLNAEFSDALYGLEKQEGSKFSLSDDDAVEKFLSLCPEDALPLFEALQAAYSASVLSKLLRGQSSLSGAMIASYEQHSADLKLLKGLVKDYLGSETYANLFRGPKTNSGDYDINKLPEQSYTAYIAGEKLANKKGCTQASLVKNIRTLCESSPELQADERFAKIKDRLYADDGEFLSKQKTRANGAIPYQLHLEELDRIIEKQGRYYPFLLDNKELLDKLVSSRVPYYVGPLNAGRDPNPCGYPNNPIDNGRRKFSWSVRRPGKEHAEAHPWNVDEVVDVEETAERFIQRMTGTCTYLYGEPVLPRHSLLYEEYCVLNELNGARWGKQDRDGHRFDNADRKALVEELFKARRGVSHKAVSKWFERRHGIVDACVSGTQADTGFESKLGSYNDFCDILNVERLEDERCPLSMQDIEQIILWNTIFEDRDILKRKLNQTYGGALSSAQINKIVKKRYQGWGRLSRKLLCGLKTETAWGSMSIMDILREGDPTTGRHARAMNFMEILHEDTFGFEQLIDEANEKRLGERGTALSIDDMPGSPALRRSVNQALRIVDEIVGIVGHEPTSIVIETTRDEQRKGVRTTKRHDALKTALEAFRADVADFDPDLLKELDNRKEQLDDDRLMLYFAQAGKCMYSGDVLDIRRLSDYHIDHIIPQAYIKDDSLDNRVLVKQELNERKLDSLLLPSDIVRSQRVWWAQLHDAKLISDKKYFNLTREHIGDAALKGFINRQLVETSQAVKFVRQMCEQRYPGTHVISLRASLSHGLRESCHFAKCRELNDFHHAHDAYLACQLSRFLGYRYPTWRDGFELAIVRKYIENLAQRGKVTNNVRLGRAGFIVDSFLRDGFDRETGEVFKDAWDAQHEVARIARALDMKQCFISRMTEEQTGAFWDETPYSPRDERHKPESLLPVKGFGTADERDTTKYGGFDNPQRAYFFIFQAYDKKGRLKYFFEGVPIHLLAAITRSSEALAAYAEQRAQAAGCSSAHVLRARVPFRQKFEMEGTEFYLSGRSGRKNVIRPAVEIAGDNELAATICAMNDDASVVSFAEYARTYAALASGLAKTCPKLSDRLELSGRSERFEELEPAEKATVLRNILAVAKGASQSCDIKLIGGHKQSGVMLEDIGKHIPDITWIDQSVTGMFERRTTLEDMQRGL